MENTKQLSKAETAHNILSEKIRSREYEPGFRLVLSQLAEELNMSVVPVREAIRQLEAEGLVDYQTNIGARVSTYNREAYFQTMEAVALLEACATKLSMPFLQREDLDEALAINQRMSDLLEDFQPEQFTKLNKQFHEVLFRHCPNTHLISLVREEWQRLDYHRVSTFRYVPQRAADSVREHKRIVALIEAGADPAYVERVCRDHRMATADLYRQLLEDQNSNVKETSHEHEPSKTT